MNALRLRILAASRDTLPGEAEEHCLRPVWRLSAVPPEANDGAAPVRLDLRTVLNPVRACFDTAVREGKVRHNPPTGATLPHRERVRDDDREEIRALTREQLATFLAVVHSHHRTMFRLLAATGIASPEQIALEWRHLRLDGSEPAVRVRRAIVRGRVEPPKSRHAR